MKRLLLTYLGCMAIVFLLPVTLAMISNSNDNVETQPPYDETSLLPKEISVFFADEGVTKQIDLEEYVKGVLPAEMPALFEPQAQKAQAVAARTYIYYKYVNFTKDPSTASPDHPEAVVCTNPSHCNAYYSPQQLVERHGEKWVDDNLEKIRSYVDETRGEILVYDDEPILAVFHSASAGGSTEASGDVWGKEMPYLVSVKSVGEEQKDGFTSTVIVSHADFTKKVVGSFSNASFSHNANSWIGKITKTHGNHVGSVVIGGVEIKGTQVRTMFGLKSTYFDISIDSENVTFSVEGSGHGVGMSQYGANYMAKGGANYMDILESYYSGAKIVKY